MADRTRVKPRVTAERYLESIDEAKRGIVLLHDRVGHVGSSYAIDVAQRLVPALKARGYVFAAPCSAFSPLVLRAPREPGGSGARAVSFADLDGDGRADLCVRRRAERVCLAVGRGAPERRAISGLGPLFRGRSRRRASGPNERPLPDADAAPTAWTPTAPRASFGGPSAPAISTATVAPTLRAGTGRRGVRTSTGHGFARATVWLRDGMTDEDGWRDASEARTASLQLADVNGDGRADLCADSPAGIVCALAP